MTKKQKSVKKELHPDYPGHGKSKIMKKLAKKFGKKTELKYVDVSTMDLGDMPVPTPRSWCGIPFGVSKSGFIPLDDVKTTETAIDLYEEALHTACHALSMAICNIQNRRETTTGEDASLSYASYALDLAHVGLMGFLNQQDPDGQWQGLMDNVAFDKRRGKK